MKKDILKSYDVYLDYILLLDALINILGIILDISDTVKYQGLIQIFSQLLFFPIIFIFQVLNLYNMIDLMIDSHSIIRKLFILS